MATFPTIDFTQYQWQVNDDNYLEKHNAQQVATVTLQENINTFGGEVEQELSDALTTAEQTRQQAITDTNAIADTAAGYRDSAQGFASDASTSADESAQSASDALQYRNETQQIAAGDVAITDLQPGSLTDDGDFVSVDAGGNLVKRSLLNGTQAVSLKTYQLKATPITGSVSVDQTVQLMYPVTLDGTVVSISLPSIADVPSGYGFVAMLHIDTTAGGSIDWDADMTWDEGAPPELAAAFMRVLLAWDGVRWTGTLGASR